MQTGKKSNQAPQNDALPLNRFNGLDNLKRILERDFFAETSLKSEPTGDDQLDLIIHLKCNFGLTESLFHLNNGNWGNFQSCKTNDVRVSPFHTALLELENENGATIDIKEISIHLRDTSIIISRQPDCHIQDHLEQILEAISANFVHFTKGLSKMPYEIFVPIYEETENNFSKSRQHNNSDYLTYWALYFEDEAEALVYDVKNKVIIEESDFFLLHQWG